MSKSKKHRPQTKARARIVQDEILALCFVLLLVLGCSAVMTHCSKASATKGSKIIKAVEEANPGEIRLTTGNTVNFRGEFDSGSVQEAQKKIQKLARVRGAKTYPIYLVLDSPGGSVDDGMYLINYANSVGNIHTITLDGASMAAMTAQLISGKRYVTGDSSMMFHRAKIGGIGGQIEVGEVESRVAAIKAMLRSIGTRVAQRLGLSYADYSNKIKDELWLYGSGIVDAGAADAVVTIKCSKTLEDSKEKGVKSFFVFTTEVEYSGCPLFRYPL